MLESAFQLSIRKFVLNCDVVFFTAAMWQSSTLPRSISLIIKVSRRFVAVVRFKPAGATAVKAAVVLCAGNGLGQLEAIGCLSRELERTTRGRTCAFARVMNFFNQLPVLGQDYAF